MAFLNPSSAMDSKKEPDVSYHSISPEMDRSEDGSSRPKIELGNHPQLAQKRGVVATILVQVCSALWLVPVGALLYLNFSGYIIGASAWCPGGHCWLEMFNPVSHIPQGKLVKFEEEDHNLLGGLQLVAKAIEVWFVFISAALVYLVTMNFASKHEGLPIGYLTRPIEFADPVTLVDPLLWRTGPSPFANSSPRDRVLGWRVCTLITLSVSLCILCNLMGPATAVLVIPSLQWLEAQSVGSRQFTAINSAQPPILAYDQWFWWWTRYCSDAQFEAHEFSCVWDDFGVTLDEWVAGYIATQGDTMATTSQNYLTFATNKTSKSTSTSIWDLDYSESVYWGPSRQIVSNLSSDAAVISSLSSGLSRKLVNKVVEVNGLNSDPIETYYQFNISRDMEVTRNGPILGAISNMWLNYDNNSDFFWTTTIDYQRSIRCYADYNLAYTPADPNTSDGYYTKCIRTGSGWSSANKEASFFVEGRADPTRKNNTAPGVDVQIFSSDKAVFFPNGTIPDWLPTSCLTTDSSRLNGTKCDWDRLFTISPQDPMRNRTENVNTIEYNYRDGNDSLKFSSDFVALLAFTNYTLKPSPINNPTLLVTNDNLPTEGKNVAVDPTWILAAWAVDENGTIGSNRTMSNLLLEQVALLLTNKTAGLATDTYYIDYVALLPTMQTLSLIDHSTTWRSDAEKNRDPDHPILKRHGRIYVWAYKLGSRTSHLGAAVGIIGCVVVLAQVFLGFTDRRRYRSPTQLLVAALEHAPRGEFEGRGHDERAMASTRFHIQDDDKRRGKFSFYEPVTGETETEYEDKTVR